jgi:hypothetical protein
VHATRHISEQNSVANNAKSPKDNTEESTALKAIRDKSRRHVRGGAKEIAGNGKQLNFGDSPGTKTLNNGR